MSAAQKCRKNGWGVGTRLRGTEEKGTQWEDTTVIEITAIGREMVLAVKVSSSRYDQVSDMEGSWDLDGRFWRRV